MEFIIEKIIIGGFPGNIGKKVSQPKAMNRAYVKLLAEVDMSRVSDVKRDPAKVNKLLRSLARNTTTLANISTLSEDIQTNEKSTFSRPTAVRLKTTIRINYHSKIAK